MLFFSCAQSDGESVLACVTRPTATRSMASMQMRTTSSSFSLDPTCQVCLSGGVGVVVYYLRRMPSHPHAFVATHSLARMKSGSIVSIKYRRGSKEMTTSLVRACTADLADKKRMFELL